MKDEKKSDFTGTIFRATTVRLLMQALNHAIVCAERDSPCACCRAVSPPTCVQVVAPLICTHSIRVVRALRITSTRCRPTGSQTVIGASSTHAPGLRAGHGRNINATLSVRELRRARARRVMDTDGPSRWEAPIQRSVCNCCHGMNG